MSVEFREEPCRSALNRVQGMPFKWSLNPYMGCAHRCTFCYVRGFERRADRPSGEAYGRSVRVKINIAEVLRRELARKSWKREVVAIGAATDPYQPAEGRYQITRGCLQAFAEARSPFSLITRGPMIVRDLDVLRRAAMAAEVDVTFSIPTLDLDVWRRTEPGTAPPRQRLRALRMLIDAGIDTGVGIAPEHLQRIFDLYFTTKEKGSGIGLSMVYRTVQMHDGEIEVQSTPGSGTTFRILLPQA
jgi:DNA repair photolyase